MADSGAHRLVEDTLRDRCQEVERLIGGHVLLMSGPLYYGVDSFVREAIEERVGTSGAAKRLAVILTTTGGLLEPVRRIVCVFRRHYETVDFIIPDSAFSAGTVLAMSGDSIYMDYFSRLGPIDPQHKKGDKFVPALGYLEKWNELVEKDRKGLLTTGEMQVMIECFDQAELHQFEEAQKESVALLTEWLVKYKFKNWTTTKTNGRKVDEEMKKKRAEEIGINLNDTKKWHSHGYGISREVLEKEVKLRIDDLDEPSNHALRDAVRSYSELADDYMSKVRHNGRVHTVGISKTY